MPMRKKELNAFRQAIIRGPYRSPLFWWLVEQHDELTANGAAGRQDWKRHCETMAREGVIDAKGKAPSIETARKAWQVVRKEVAVGRATWPPLPEPKPAGRSRQQTDWQPPVSAPPPTASTPRPRHHQPEKELPPRRPLPDAPTQSASSDSGDSELDDLPPEVKAKFDRLRQDFAETDRKRFGTF